MYQATVISWIVLIIGILTILPLLYAQLVLLLNPEGQKAKDILVGKGKDWRDKTHFKSAVGMAWADWLIFLPIFIFSIIGVIMAEPWGYVLLAVSGAIQVYINTVLWFLEKEYVYPICGPLVYYTYYWGNFIYWGVTAMVYSILKLYGVDI